MPVVCSEEGAVASYCDSSDGSEVADCEVWVDYCDVVYVCSGLGGEGSAGAGSELWSVFDL